MYTYTNRISYEQYYYSEIIGKKYNDFLYIIFKRTQNLIWEDLNNNDNIHDKLIKEYFKSINKKNSNKNFLYIDLYDFLNIYNIIKKDDDNDNITRFYKELIDFNLFNNNIEFDSIRIIDKGHEQYDYYYVLNDIEDVKKLYNIFISMILFFIEINLIILFKKKDCINEIDINILRIILKKLKIIKNTNSLSNLHITLFEEKKQITLEEIFQKFDLYNEINNILFINEYEKFLLSELRKYFPEKINYIISYNENINKLIYNIYDFEDLRFIIMIIIKCLTDYISNIIFN